ncbi:MAG: ATP-binding protein [Alphaproteobacteria bacterium]|nr:ATP-binding protein [Alphaproteobacteria bacterium]
MTETENLLPALLRIAEALERISPTTHDALKLDKANAWVWQGQSTELIPVENFSALPVSLLQGIDHVSEILRKNTLQFAKGLPANNALLWGARGMGKSSLIKAIFAQLIEDYNNLSIIEIHRDDLASLDALLNIIRNDTKRYIIYCDDMSFDAQDSSYKSLKTVLDGSIAGRPDNVIFYATSNRRHLMPREMMENERGTAIHASEALEEKVSLSDRFGLWLGFHGCNQEEYLSMIDGYAKYFGIENYNSLHKEALEWAITRGSRSGRVAWQFMTDLAGRKNIAL